MPIKVEAAVVTQKQPSAAFNTDSININGKVFPREIIKNGYKGSGIISGNSYFVLSSSAVEGFADATVAAFNNRAKTFDVSRDARNVFSGFYEDCRSALLNMDRDENQLKSACLYACGRKTVLACNYDSGLFMFRNGEFSEVNTEQAQATVADYKNRVFSDITEGDIFLLVSSAVSEVLTQKDFGDICKISDGSVKKIVSLASKVALSKNPSGAVSVFAVKILETAVEDEDSLGFASVFASRENEENTTVASDKTAEKNDIPESLTEEKVEENAEDNGFVASPDEVETPVENVGDVNYETDTETAENSDYSSNPLDIDNVFDEAEVVTDEQKDAKFIFDENVGLSEKDENANENIDDEEIADDENSEQSGNKRVKLFIALFSLVALSVFLFIVIFFVRGFSNSPVDDVNGTEESSSQTEESTTDEENESETENESTETTSEDETTSVETSSKKEEKTTAKRENITPSRQEPEVIPTSEPETTKAEEETEKEEPTASSSTESEPAESESDESQSETSFESQEPSFEQPTQEATDAPTEESVETSENNLPVTD